VILVLKLGFIVKVL